MGWDRPLFPILFLRLVFFRLAVFGRGERDEQFHALAIDSEEHGFILLDLSGDLIVFRDRLDRLAFDLFDHVALAKAFCAATLSSSTSVTSTPSTSAGMSSRSARL